MGRRRRVEVAENLVEEEVSRVWLKAEIEFASTFSYRQPDASAQFAIGSPIPSPATIKLTLVDTAIRWNGSVELGRQVFDWLKTCKVHCVPPERVVRFRAFLGRLKPREGELLKSTGVRDYFLLDGCLTVFLQVPADKAETVKELLLKVRRLGSSDSLCWCREVEEVSESELPCEFFARKLEELPENILQKGLAQGLLVVRLSDLAERSQFDHFNPFGGTSRSDSLEKGSYLLPLKMERYGETWALLKRVPLPTQLKGL